MPEWEVTSTQIGAAAENVVANCLMICSSGRLSPFQPVADDFGIDLLVLDKETGRTVSLQIKSRTPTASKTVHFSIREKTLARIKNKHLLLVSLDKCLKEMEVAWFISVDEFRDIVKPKDSGVYAIEPSKDSSSKDKFSKFRVHSCKELVKRIIELMNET